MLKGSIYTLCLKINLENDSQRKPKKKIWNFPVSLVIFDYNYHTDAFLVSLKVKKRLVNKSDKMSDKKDWLRTASSEFSGLFRPVSANFVYFQVKNRRKCFRNKLYRNRETCPTSKSGWTGLQCPGGRIDSSKSVLLFETLADSFHGLTKYSFDKNKFPVKEKKDLQLPHATKFRARGLNVVNRV